MTDVAPLPDAEVQPVDGRAPEEQAAEGRAKEGQAPVEQSPEEQACDLSIIIVSYNTCGALEDCLRSLIRNREESPGLEVFVVDNDSHDGSPEMVAGKFPEVRLIRSPTNVGFAAGNNLALRESTGRYVFLLNSDTIVHRGTLRHLVNFMEAHPEAGAVGPRLLHPDGTLQRSVRHFPTPRVLLYQYTIFRLWKPWASEYVAYKMKGWPHDEVRPIDIPMGAALFVRGATLRELGGLDEGYFMYYEEADLCRRLHARGDVIYFDPAASITHRGGESSRQAKDFLFRISLESMFRYVRSDLSPGEFAVFSLTFKLGFAIKLLVDVPVLWVRSLSYRWISHNARKLDSTRAELARSLRFLESGLGWLCFRLGRR